MASMKATLMKLQNALNANGDNIMVNYTQFYSPNLMRPVTMIHIKRAFRDEHNGKYYYTELFRTPSIFQAVLYLRDLWYELNGWELPTENEVWNDLRPQQETKDDES